MRVVCFLDEWMMFDDENVSMVTSEDILKLSGGGEVFSVWLSFWKRLLHEHSRMSSIHLPNFACRSEI